VTSIYVRGVSPNTSARTRQGNLRSLSPPPKLAVRARSYSFSRPAGWEKLHLPTIIAREMGVNIKATSGPVVRAPGDLAALLTNIEEARRSLHRRDSSLNHVVEEVSIQR